MFWGRRLIARELVRALGDIDPALITTWSSPISEVHVVVIRHEHVRAVTRTVVQAGGFRSSTQVDGVWSHHDEKVIVRIAVPADDVALVAARQADMLRRGAERAAAMRVSDWVHSLVLPERDEVTNRMVAAAQAAVADGPFGRAIAVCPGDEPHATLAVLLSDLVAPPRRTTAPTMLAATMVRTLVSEPTLIDVADALTRQERRGTDRAAP